MDLIYRAHYSFVKSALHTITRRKNENYTIKNNVIIETNLVRMALKLTINCQHYKMIYQLAESLGILAIYSKR